MEKIRQFIVKNATWLIFGLAIVVYIPSVHFDYVYDDELLILDNVHTMKGMDGLGEIWTTNMSHGVEGHNDGLFRPIPQSIFALQIEFFGKDPFYSHLFNILLYGILCVLIFRLLSEIFQQIDKLYLFFLVLVFVVHPVHVETVANIKSLDEILALLFPLLGIYAVLKYELEGLKKNILLSLFLLVGLLSKESTISWVLIIPIFLLIIDKQTTKDAIINFGFLAIVAILWYGWHENIINSVGRPVDAGLFSEASNSSLIPKEWYNQKATGVWITFHYLKQLFYPFPLVADYSPESIKVALINSIEFIFSATVFVIMLFVAYKQRKNNPWISLSIFSWFVFIAPVSNIFMHIGVTYAERLSFTPSFSLILLGCSLFIVAKNQKLIFYACLFLTSFFSYATINRIPDWKSNIDLFRSDVEKFPNNYKLHYNYATHLVKEIPQDKVITDEQKEINELAITYYKNSLKINPTFLDGLNNLANAYRRSEKYEKAVEVYGKILSQNDAYQKAYYNRGITYFVWVKYEKAVSDLSHYAKRKKNLQVASALYYCGLASGHLSKFPDAILFLNESLEIKQSWEAYNFLGMAYGNTGEWNKAVISFQKALEINQSDEIKKNLEMAMKAVSAK